MSSSASDSEESNSPPPMAMEPAKPLRGAKTLVKLAEEGLMRQLKSSVEGFHSTSNYCCGGTALFPACGDEAGRDYSPMSRMPNRLQAPPVVLRWDTSDDDCTQKIKFPFQPDTAQKDARSLEHLIKTMTPNSLKRKREEGLEDNKQFGELNNDQFSVDFDPYACGIVDGIAQTLFRGYYLRGMERREEHQGIAARLRTLQIQSGTARSFPASPNADKDSRVGFLLVRLPHPFEGGQLQVSHQGHSTLFDWSKSKPDTVDWAAFDIKCDYEVFDVTAGHRLTLIYDLYFTERVGGIFGNPPLVAPKYLPFYEITKGMLEQPAFMIHGGKLGLYCSHKYRHTSRDFVARVPFVLEGVDATVFSVFRELGLKATVELVWKPRKILYQMCVDEEEKDAGLTYEDWKKSTTWVSNNWGQVDYNRCRGDSFFDEEWPHEQIKNVVWLNEPSNWELALVNIIDGNWNYSTDIDSFESHVVIFIKVPKRGDRVLNTA